MVGLIIAFFSGTFCGVVLMCIFQCAGQADRDMEREDSG